MCVVVGACGTATRSMECCSCGGRCGEENVNEGVVQVAWVQQAVVWGHIAGLCGALAVHAAIVVAVTCLQLSLWPHTPLGIVVLLTCPALTPSACPIHLCQLFLGCSSPGLKTCLFPHPPHTG